MCRQHTNMFSNRWDNALDVAKLPRLVTTDQGRDAVKGRYATAQLPQADERGSIAVLGAHYVQRDDIARGVAKLSTDTVRMNALQQISQLPVFGVAGGRSGEKHPLSLVGDVRKKETWQDILSDPADLDPAGPVGRNTRRSRHVRDARDARVVVLDYYWLESTYYNRGSNSAPNGYGNKWVSDWVPMAFEKDNFMAFFVPNDVLAIAEEEKTGLGAGYMLKFVADNEEKLSEAGITYKELTLAESMQYNPLFRATQAATEDQSAWERSVLPNNQSKTNEQAVGRFLHKERPTIMFYRESAGLEKTKTYLKSIMRDPRAESTSPGSE